VQCNNSNTNNSSTSTNSSSCTNSSSSSTGSSNRNSSSRRCTNSSTNSTGSTGSERLELKPSELKALKRLFAVDFELWSELQTKQARFRLVV
jgi:hypothetical protein